MINLNLEDYGISCNLIGKIDKYLYKQFAQVSADEFLDFLMGADLKPLLEDILVSFHQNITDLTFFYFALYFICNSNVIN